MKILISSYAFSPSVGGIEEITELLAEEFCAEGHSVAVVTATRSSQPDRFPYDVVRVPTTRQLVSLVRWCDVYLQVNISLRLAWPLLAFRRPWIVSEQVPLSGARGIARIGQSIKKIALRFARVIACSHATAEGLGIRATVIPNPYRDRIFRRITPANRPHDLAFLGRLVSDKGVNILIDALALLRERNRRPSVLIIGGGPEEAALRSRCAASGLAEHVRFAGIQRGEALVQALNQCKILVVPSIWPEPFGLVALEGIACGCVVIASNTGGLPEAVGPCGPTFPMGDAGALADCILQLLQDEDRRKAFLAKAEDHLAAHTPRSVAAAYLRVMAGAGSAGR